METIEKHELVRHLMASRGWVQVVQPALLERLVRNMKLLRDRSKTRRDKLPDDYIVGRMDEAEALFSDLENVIRQHEEEVREKKDEATLTDDALARALLGRYGPFMTEPAYNETGDR